MAYYLDLFTPETWAKFRESGEDISGFRLRQKKSAEKINPGDIFLCYLVRVSRWAGALEVLSGPFLDDTPIFDDPDPYQVRFKVRVITTFTLEEAIPIDAEGLWERLSLTRDIKKRVMGWAQHANLRASLREIPDSDGKLILDVLHSQADQPKTHPLSAIEQRRITSTKTIRATDRHVIVEVPEEDEPAAGAVEEYVPEDTRESHMMQANLAMIGFAMDFKVWVPKSDRQKVKDCLSGDLEDAFLDILPLNYDDTTIRTIQQIDVIWLRNRSIARAFEVEHTTAIYSGLLRMADLLALQPNMAINLHIVAPSVRREKVLREIRRPVFSLLDSGPLYESCTFIPYEAIEEIADMKHLSHMSDSILDEYEESAQED